MRFLFPYSNIEPEKANVDHTDSNDKESSNFQVRLLQAKKQVLSGCKVLANLLRYVICKDETDC